MHPGLTVERYLETLLKSSESWDPLLKELWDSLGLELLREEGLKYLSTGELRKVLLFHALALNPSLLVFEDVLEGLDASTRKELIELFHRLAKADSRKETDISRTPSLLFLCDRMDQIPPCVTHLLQLNRGKVLSETPLTPNEFLRVGSDAGVLEISSPGESSLETSPFPHASPLIRMRSVRVAYQDKVVFEGFNFDLYPGEHCLVQGPNGCGKSTLVKLITGEHPQAWMNDITVANIHRGTGESVKEVSMQTSLVSQSLHHAFLQLESIETLEVVLSGFFGTIGLYEPAGEEKIQEAQEALELCGLNGQENRLFKDLPWGIQRLVLAARAFVRRPPLMILDEPCTGLDEDHRRILLEALDKIGEEQSTTILLVTHDPAERLACLRAELVFHPNGSARKGQPRYYPEFRRL
jgi:molybdate transport system ATP-binding protein